VVMPQIKNVAVDDGTIELCVKVINTAGYPF